MNLSVAELRRNRELLLRRGEHAKALEFAERLVERAPCREAYFRLGYLYREVGRLREALACFQRALLFRKGQKSLIPDIHLQTAYVWYQRRNFKRMREAIRRAYACRYLPSTGYRFHHALGNYYSLQNLHRQALEEFEKSLVLVSAPQQRSVTLDAMSACHLRLGNLREARRLIEQGRRINLRHGYLSTHANNRTVLAGVYFDMGRPRLAMGILKRVATLYERLGKTRHAAAAWMNAGYAASECDEVRSSLDFLEHAISVSKPEDGRHTLICAHACQARMLVEDGRYDRGYAALATARQMLRGHRNPIAKIFVLRAEARVARHFGDWGKMRGAARKAETIARRLHDFVRVAEFQAMRSEAEAALGRPRAARLASRSCTLLREHVASRGRGSESLGERAMKFAAASMSVLLVGESGTGKTALARMMHCWSPRGRRRCIVVPCEQLVHAAADLCGHAAGAWSGAHGSALGWIRRGEGGTVVLDRVDELAPEDQRILVPILERRVRPVGSTEEIRVNVRFIATCREPAKLIPGVRNRLAVAILRVPPLRDRRGEIPDFIHRFLRNRRQISCEAVAELSRMDWEGNLAELEAATDRLVAMSDRWIGVSELRRSLWGGRAGYGNGCTSRDASLNSGGGTK